MTPAPANSKPADSADPASPGPPAFPAAPSAGPPPALPALPAEQSAPDPSEPTSPAEPPPGEAKEVDPKAGPPIGLIVGAVIIGAALLVVVALGMPFLLQQLRSSAVTYSVGECVVQDGGNARVVGCTHPGAYKIISRVDTRDGCPDPTLPTVATADDVFCLRPIE